MKIFVLLLLVLPAVLSQLWMLAAYRRARAVEAALSGFRAARDVLDAAGLNDVPVEELPGFLSDHYDGKSRTLRLSREVYHGRTLMAIGIATHEAGHALQHARRFLPQWMRGVSIALAIFGGTAGLVLLALGLIFCLSPVAVTGAGMFVFVTIVQLLNLPLEWNAGRLGRSQLLQIHDFDDRQMQCLRQSTRAAALSHLAATLQSVLTLVYNTLRFAHGRRL